MMPNLANDFHLLAFGLPGGWEWIAVLVIGLLIFGRRLPEVGRSIGRSIVEFKKGIKGIEDEIEQESNRPAERSERLAAQSGTQSGTQSGARSESDTAGRYDAEKQRNPYASSE